MHDSRWFSLGEAAALLGHDRPYVRRLGRRGHLVTRLVYDRGRRRRCTVVSKTSIEEYIAARTSKRSGSITIDGIAYVTPTTAAEILGMTVKGVRHHIYRGTLTTARHTKGYGHKEALLPIEEVNELHEARDLRRGSQV